MGARLDRTRRRLRAPLIATGVCAALGACGGGALHSAPPVVYPDAAWAANIEGDVIVETCNSPSSPHVVSGRPELTAAALEMAAGGWKRAPRSEGTRLENCRQTRFAFRRSPTPSEAATLSADEDTVFVARGLQLARIVACPPHPEATEATFVEGLTYAELTIDQSGHVSNVALISSVGSAREEAELARMKACTFFPASVGGQPFVSRFKVKMRWERGD